MAVYGWLWANYRVFNFEMNPLRINFHYYLKVWALAQTFPRRWDRFRVWFMPLTWRPAGVTAFAPLAEITPANQIKFESKPFADAVPYLAAHIVIGLL